MRRALAWLLLGAGVCAAALAQNTQEPAVGQLTGTLKTIRDTGTIKLGFRESSLPFSFYNKIKQPIGYSIDLCREVVEDVASELGAVEIKIAFVPVTSANRFEKVKAGEVDLECGSTTSNVQRQKEVAFSPTFFVAGTKLMVPKAPAVKSYRDLGGKTVVVTAGTTNEAALRALSDKQKLAMTFVTAPDHAQSLETLVAGKADAFATDDVLLYGFLAKNNLRNDYLVVGDFLSYDPYGIMYRRNDPQLETLVQRTFEDLAQARELARTYEQWFLRKLPSGNALGISMSPQLRTIFEGLGQDTE